MLYVGELESDDDELNEDDIVYVENLAKRVNKCNNIISTWGIHSPEERNKTSPEMVMV